jgi:DNA end-binding protein Ku
MRTVWKGTITFGLVSIPVAVYPATREDKVAFKQLRKSDISPIRYKKVAEADDQEVPAEEIVKGYEYEKGKWVTLEDKDFEALGGEAGVVRRRTKDESHKTSLPASLEGCTGEGLGAPVLRP